jgi:hypothetical protein
VAGKKIGNPRFALKMLQLIGIPLAGAGIATLLAEAATGDEFAACGVAEAASSMNVASSPLLHQCSWDNATGCAEEFVPGVFPPNNPEQPTRKIPNDSTARACQNSLVNREMFTHLLTFT